MNNYRMAADYNVQGGHFGAPGLHGCAAGMGGCGCAGMAGTCGCGGSCGMGLFDSGMDFTTWAWPEWSIVGLVGYMLLSTIFTTRRAVGRVQRLPEDARRAVKRGRRRLGERIAGD